MFTQTDYPACFPSRKQYEAWAKFAASSVPRRPDGRPDHCYDCLPWFKAAMEKLGRCESPETVFTHVQSRGLDPEPYIVGISPRLEPYAKLS